MKRNETKTSVTGWKISQALQSSGKIWISDYGSLAFFELKKSACTQWQVGKFPKCFFRLKQQWVTSSNSWFQAFTQPKGGGSGMLRKARAKSFPWRSFFFITMDLGEPFEGPWVHKQHVDNFFYKWMLYMQRSFLFISAIFFHHPFFTWIYGCVFQMSWEKNRHLVKLRQKSWRCGRWSMLGSWGAVKEPIPMQLRSDQSGRPAFGQLFGICIDIYGVMGSFPAFCNIKI